MEHDGRNESTRCCSSRARSGPATTFVVMFLAFAVAACSGGSSGEPVESAAVTSESASSDDGELFESAEVESSAADGESTSAENDSQPTDSQQRDGESVEQDARPEVEASAPTGGAGDVNDAAPVDTAVGGVPNAIDVTVPNVEQPVDEPVPADEVAAPTDGVEIRLVRREAVDVTTELPGEIGGPALLVGVEFSNRTGAEVDLGAVTVNLEYGSDDTPASQVTTEPAEPVSGILADGASTIGLYVFTVPSDARSDVDLYVSYSVDIPTAAFTGEFPNG